MAMTGAQVRDLQRDLNAFTRHWVRGGTKPITVDGDRGSRTNQRVRDVKFWLGFGEDHQDAAVGPEFRFRLAHPRKVRRAHKAHDRIQVKRGRKRRRAHRAAHNRLLQALNSAQWGGSRAVTNEVIRIVNGRAAVTSRKRSETFGNPGSDHHVSQTSADAVDFAIAEAHWLKNEISRRLGGPSSLADYGTFTIRRNGRLFRVQIIAGTHGTGPHLHVGVRRSA